MNVISGRVAVPESVDNDITASQLVSSGHSVDGSGQGEQIARQGLHHGNCTLDSDRPPKETTKSVVDQPLQAHAPPVEQQHDALSVPSVRASIGAASGPGSSVPVCVLPVAAPSCDVELRAAVHTEHCGVDVCVRRHGRHAQ